MRKPLVVAGLALCALASSAALSAHHSTAMFDRVQVRTLEGTVVDFQWTNPHAWIQVSAPGPDGTMVEWSQAFGGATVFVPEDDKQWITRPDSAIELWSGAREVLPGVTLVQTGGHFEGSAVVHWAAGAGGRGALLTGDSISVVQDRRWVTFMRSYPNQIPLPASLVRGIVEAVRPYAFDRIYGGWWPSVVAEGGKAAIERSAERYIDWITR